MSISFPTAFADCGQILAAFANINAFSGAGPQVSAYFFTVSAVTTAPTVGATYTNNGIKYTVIAVVAATGTTVAMVGAGAPTATGTLTKSAGTGDSTLTFSAVTAYTNWIQATVSAVTTSPVAGATYTNNGFTYTVLATVSSTGTTIALAGNGIPTQSATLTKASGTGDASLTVTAITGSYTNWVAATGVQTSYVGPVVKSQAAMVNAILARLEGAGLTSLIPSNNWQATLAGIGNSLNSQQTALANLLQSVIIQRVNNDVPQNNITSLQQAMTEWIRQMQAQSVTVAQATLSSTVTAGSNNTGTAVPYASLYDENGLLLEYSFAETMVLRCTGDRFTGATAGSEPVSVTSPAQATSNLSYLWPAGSGLTASLTVVDPTQGYGSGQNLVGGGSTSTGAFKAWTGSIPNGWAVNTGGALISDGTTNNYGGSAHCLAVTGDGSTELSIYQNFANGGITTGSPIVLAPNTVYQLYFQVMTPSVPAACVLKVSLTDGSLAVINNNQGNANTFSLNLNTADLTTWQTVTATFQTPTIMPTNCRLEIYTTTALSSAKVMYIDFLALTQPTAQNYGGMYTGGPYMSIFRGNVDLITWTSYTIGDSWNVAIANNNGSASPAPMSFNSLMNQMLGLAANGQILPSAGTPSVSNNLIS